MKPEDNDPAGQSNAEEWKNAEAAARQFLEQNCQEIAGNLNAKLHYLETLIHRLSLKKTAFADRLEYLARVSEIAALIQQDADGFFATASQPVVARILSTVPLP
jgi:hypothetical protein